MIRGKCPMNGKERNIGALEEGPGVQIPRVGMKEESSPKLRTGIMKDTDS